MATAVRQILILMAVIPTLLLGGCPGNENTSGYPGRIQAVPLQNSLCAGGSASPTMLNIGIPESICGIDEKASKSLTGLAAWLSTKIGVPVIFVPISNYSDFTEGLRNGRLQAALIPPAEYVQAKKAMPCLRLAATTVYGTAIFYDANIIVHRDSTLRSFLDLKGRRIAFYSPRSASGYIYAANFLAGKDMLPWRDYEPVFTGSHRLTIEAVQQKTVDAGATFTDALRISSEGGLDLSDISILAVAGRIPSEPLVISHEISPDLTRRITNAFLEIDGSTREERELLGPHDLMSGWVETDESIYSSIDDVINEVESFGYREVTE